MRFREQEADVQWNWIAIFSYTASLANVNMALLTHPWVPKEQTIRGHTPPPF